MTKPLVLYHANCPDGFCAAWVISRMLGHEGAEYVPINYGVEPPDVTGRTVYVLDFSFKPPVMDRLIGQARDILLLDHHKTAEQDLAAYAARSPQVIDNGVRGFLNVVFDMDRSGAGITWDYFHPEKLHTEKRRPWLVDYVEDRDLWRWKLPFSREINAFLGSHPRSFALWDTLNRVVVGSQKWQRFINEGAAILRYEATLVDRACLNAVEMNLGGYRILAAHTTVLFSEVAGRLAEGRPFGVAWFYRSDGKIQWSLRSRDADDEPFTVDVSEVARQFGGGGHRNAAGFEEDPVFSPHVRRIVVDALLAAQAGLRIHGADRVPQHEGIPEQFVSTPALAFKEVSDALKVLKVT